MSSVRKWVQMCSIALIYKLTVYLLTKYLVSPRNKRDSCINRADERPEVSFSRHLYFKVTWHCQSMTLLPFKKLDKPPRTICKRQLLYMYLMSTRKSSNFRTIMVLEIIPTEKDVINFRNILFVYSRPLTRKRFSVVNFPRKRRVDASEIGSNFLNEAIHRQSNKFVICYCSKSF